MPPAASRTGRRRVLRWLLLLRLSPGERIALLRQPLELGLLLGDPLGRQLFVRRSRIGGRLLDQLAEVVRYHCDAVVELGDAQRIVRSG